ncbi:hypothetical protein [Streptomyces sp. NPDC002088]|uniref:hypothetical protein n=1 Tax=Streptomyces sp. NPDC002088 TaxID=3154665 RepID=UPI00332F34FA
MTADRDWSRWLQRNSAHGISGISWQLFAWRVLFEARIQALRPRLLGWSGFMHVFRRNSKKASVLALMGVFTLLAAQSADASVPPQAARDPLPQVSCGWPAVVNPSRLNFAFPETNATYWLMPYRLAQGDQMVVDGTYPSARFTSLTSYDVKGSPIDSLADYKIAPSQGSRNPFSDPNAGTNSAQHKYKVTLKAGVAPGSGGNTLAGTSMSAASGVGILALRIYVPDQTSDPAGSVPLPSLSIHRKDGSVRSISTCAKADSTQGPAGPLVGFLRKLVQDNAPPGGFEGCGKSSVQSPGFAIPNKASGLFPNPYNKYLCTPISHESGRVAVVRGKAPTFPNTQLGQSVLTKTQLRYWSLCQNQWQLPYPASSCAADFQTALNKDGRYTFVVSTPQDRPANATTTNRVTWLSWGPTNVSSILLFRNMLPAADFHNAVQDVGKGQNPASVMGDYFPTITYCTKAEFEKGGPDACPAT